MKITPEIQAQVIALAERLEQGQLTDAMELARELRQLHTRIAEHLVDQSAKNPIS